MPFAGMHQNLPGLPALDVAVVFQAAFTTLLAGRSTAVQASRGMGPDQSLPLTVIDRDPGTTGMISFA
jgi:hypothetical protein